MMKNKPILFCGEMVRAILAGRKTMTRRVVKSPKWSSAGNAMVDFGCPYGVPGTKLWVRETCRLYSVNCSKTGKGPLVRYRADGAWSCGCKPQSQTPCGPWKPSIHMPRWASRITLEVTDVRVERVQDISDGDAIAEGCLGLPTESGGVTWWAEYAALWDSINRKRGFGWEKNPWVWVVCFRLANEKENR
jgi:hypothetical protein